MTSSNWQNPYVFCLQRSGPDTRLSYTKRDTARPAQYAQPNVALAEFKFSQSRLRDIAA